MASPTFLVDFPYYNPRGGNTVKRRRPENIVGGVVILSEPESEFILTANHVWWALEGSPNVKLIAKDLVNDLVLYVQSSTVPHSEAVLMHGENQLSIDRFVWSFGTPFIESRFRSSSSNRARNAYALLRGKMLGMDHGKILHSADIVPGFSGFPLLMKGPSGEWVTIGINTELYFDGINGATGPAKIEKFLRRNLSHELYQRLHFLGGRYENPDAMLHRLSVWSFNTAMDKVLFPSIPK